jgi:hypothetical protein
METVGIATVTKNTVIAMMMKSIVMKVMGTRAIAMKVRGRMEKDMAITNVIKGAEKNPKIMVSCSTQFLHA